METRLERLRVVLKVVLWEQPLAKKLAKQLVVPLALSLGKKLAKLLVVPLALALAKKLAKQ